MVIRTCECVRGRRARCGRQQTRIQHRDLDTLLRTAEGNPFFLEELAWTVVEQGTAAPTLVVPETV